MNERPGERAGGGAGGADTETAPPARRCSWCSAEATEHATHCPACGASLAKRESLGDMVIPGVTAVDPALTRERSSLQTVMGLQRSAIARSTTTQALRMVPGELGIGLAAGALAIQAIKLATDHEVDGSTVPMPSEAAIQLAGRLDRGEGLPGETASSAAAAEPGPSSVAVDPWSDLPATPVDQQANTPAQAVDPWADLPAPAIDPWASGAGPWASSQWGSDPFAGDPWSTPTPDPWAVNPSPKGSTSKDRRPG
jgi:hypothetical protein